MLDGLIDGTHSHEEHVERGIKEQLRATKLTVVYSRRAMESRLLLISSHQQLKRRVELSAS